MLKCDKHSNLLQGAELPQSQIPDTIIRGSGRFDRTVTRIELDDQPALGLSIF
jgi:hypothetical protein